MYKLNMDGIKTFRMYELINFVFYLFLVVGMIVLKSFGDWYWLNSFKFILKPGSKQFNFIESTDFIPSILLIIIFTALVYQMKHYHSYEWKRLYKSIWVFFIVEISLMLYVIISDHL